MKIPFLQVGLPRSFPNDRDPMARLTYAKCADDARRRPGPATLDARVGARARLLRRGQQWRAPLAWQPACQRHGHADLILRYK